MLSNIIFVESGQCGNQVGYEILQSLYNHTFSNDQDPLESNIDDLRLQEVFFRKGMKSNKIYARCVCLDTEPKVIQSALSKASSSPWLIDHRSVAYRHGGAGNNWALGYSMFNGDYMDAAINLVRREAELCDACPILFSIHSMAGGTGSGLGAHMTEVLQDYFPDIIRANLAILPYNFGEVVVQNYNAILSLAKIASTSDAVILFENDIAHELCKRTKSIERPGIQDINLIIAANLVPILLPKYSNGMDFTLMDDVAHLCSHPGFKLLDVKTVPQTSEASIDFTYDSWPTLIKSLLRMQTVGVWSELGLSKLLSPDIPASRSHIPSFDTTRTRSLSSPTSYAQSTKTSLCATLGSVMTLRGRQASDAVQHHQEMIMNACQNKVLLRRDDGSPSYDSLSKHRSLLTTANDSSAFPATYFSGILDDPMQLCHSQDVCNRYDHSASILSNSQAVLPVLQRIITKASKLYENDAYLHQYQQFGVDDETFVKCFQDVGQIIENYKSLS